MKTTITFIAAFLMMFSIKAAAGSNYPPDSVKTEITNCLNQWNEAAKNRNLELFMSLFDDSENILLAGSDSGEVYKGKKEISGWLGMLFGFASFSWEMDRVEIDSLENTAWVFVDGRMVVTSGEGKTKKSPYRFSGVLVKKNNVWKWRMFDGSAPGGH